VSLVNVGEDVRITVFHHLIPNTAPPFAPTSDGHCSGCEREGMTPPLMITVQCCIGEKYMWHTHTHT
jgi:hypothetical protein